MDKQVKKGVLKNKQAAKQDKNAGHLQWDEEIIATQDKEHGGKMKITEPKTPYSYYDSVSFHSEE